MQFSQVHILRPLCAKSALCNLEVLIGQGILIHELLNRLLTTAFTGFVHGRWALCKVQTHMQRPAEC